MSGRGRLLLGSSSESENDEWRVVDPNYSFRPTHRASTTQNQGSNNHSVPFEDLVAVLPTEQNPQRIIRLSRHTPTVERRFTRYHPFNNNISTHQNNLGSDLNFEMAEMPSVSRVTEVQIAADFRLASYLENFQGPTTLHSTPSVEPPSYNSLYGPPARQPGFYDGQPELMKELNALSDRLIAAQTTLMTAYLSERQAIEERFYKYKFN